MHAFLNEEHNIIFDEIIKASITKNRGLYFVNGSGGTCKTFFWKTIIYKLRSDERIFLAVG